MLLCVSCGRLGLGMNDAARGLLTSKSRNREKIVHSASLIPFLCPMSSIPYIPGVPSLSSDFGSLHICTSLSLPIANLLSFFILRRKFPGQAYGRMPFCLTSFPFHLSFLFSFCHNCVPLSTLTMLRIFITDTSLPCHSIVSDPLLVWAYSFTICPFFVILGTFIRPASTLKVHIIGRCNASPALLQTF